MIQCLRRVLSSEPVPWVPKVPWVQKVSVQSQLAPLVVRKEGDVFAREEKPLTAVMLLQADEETVRRL
jgi:hypothetical protein